MTSLIRCKHRSWWVWREATNLYWGQRRRLLHALRLLLTTSKRRAFRQWADLASIWRRELGGQWRYRRLCLAVGFGMWRVWWGLIAHTSEAAAHAHVQWRRRKLMLADGFRTWRSSWRVTAAGTHTSVSESEITAHARACAAVAHASKTLFTFTDANKTLSLATHPSGRPAPETALFTFTDTRATRDDAFLGARPLGSTNVVDSTGGSAPLWAATGGSAPLWATGGSAPLWAAAGGAAPLWATGDSAPLWAALRQEALRRALDAWTDQFMRRSAWRRAHEYAQLFFHNSLLSCALVAWATSGQRRRGASQTSPEAAAIHSSIHSSIHRTEATAVEEAAAQGKTSPIHSPIHRSMGTSPNRLVSESEKALSQRRLPNLASEKALYERRVAQMQGELRAAASSALLVGDRKLPLGVRPPCTALHGAVSSTPSMQLTQPTLQPTLQPDLQLPVPPAGAALSWAQPAVALNPQRGEALSWAQPAVALNPQREDRPNQLASPLTNQLASPLTNQWASPLTNQLTNHQGFEGMSSRPKIDPTNPSTFTNPSTRTNPSTYGRSPRSGLAALIAAGAAAGAAAQAHTPPDTLALAEIRSQGATPSSATSAISASTQQLHAVLMRSRHQLLRRV